MRRNGVVNSRSPLWKSKPRTPLMIGELCQIGDALDELAKAEPSLAEVVDLKFFCGFTFGEIAAMKGISERTVQRRWEKARIYLHRSIRAELEV